MYNNLYCSISWAEYHSEIKEYFNNKPSLIDDYEEMVKRNEKDVIWNSMIGWEEMDDVYLLTQLSDLQPFNGELLIVTHRSCFPNMSPFKVDANNIVEFAQKHLEIFGECFIGGDTIIISKENKQMWLFHHEGVYTYIEFK